MLAVYFQQNNNTTISLYITTKNTVSCSQNFQRTLFHTMKKQLVKMYITIIKGFLVFFQFYIFIDTLIKYLNIFAEMEVKCKINFFATCRYFFFICHLRDDPHHSYTLYACIFINKKKKWYVVNKFASCYIFCTYIAKVSLYEKKSSKC